MIIIDYIQLIQCNGKMGREQEVAKVCRELKALARKYNIAVFVSSQLSRAVESRGGDKRPQLSDLRESGAIEQDADVVMFIHRENNDEGFFFTVWINVCRFWNW